MAHLLTLQGVLASTPGAPPGGGALPFLFIFTGQSETVLLLPEEGRGCVLLPAASAVGCADLSGSFPNLCSLCL